MPHKNIFVLLLALLSCSLQIESKHFKQAKHDVRKFPDDFMFGSATASVQIEGGWDADGKTENIWDKLTHDNPCATDDCQNPDIANDSYHKYKRDVEMIRELGLDVYRFSISWNRILPNGFSDKINEAGVQYYNNLIDELLKYNIKPFVTLFHWDLPQNLQDLGGWANPHSIDWFSDYARVVYEKFGDRVKHWSTINEAISICHFGYGKGRLAPAVVSPGIGEYMCAKNVMLAHASAYHIYDKEFRASQNGEVGIVVATVWYDPDSEEDAEAAEVAYQFNFGQYAHPIFSATGDWPPVMKERVAAKSAEQGFARSRLPEFSPEEIEQLRGSADYIGLNHYTTYIVYSNQSEVGYHDVPSLEDDYGSITYQPSHWVSAASGWLKDYSPGFYKVLKRVKDEYNNPKIYITENGFSTAPEAGLDDDVRVNYLRGYLDAMLDAMEEGSNVKMYLYWSLMDNFEWMRGYTERFGIYAVDYSSPERTRTPRKSAFVYKEIVRSRTLDHHYEPDTTIMTIDPGH